MLSNNSMSYTDHIFSSPVASWDIKGGVNDFW